MRVVVAMSGGVDSAVSALLLKLRGYEVIGIHFKTEEDTFFSKFKLTHKVCCSPDDTMDARKITKKLGIELHILDVHEEFKREVISEFVKGYEMGLTPNPCVICNRKIKFSMLRNFSKRVNAKIWATGHYSRVKNGRIMVAIDGRKDQSYFLALVKKSDVTGLILPIGELDKNKVREIAKKNGLEVSSKPDSQDVCFVPDGKLGNFFSSQGEKLSPGLVVDAEGKAIGKHIGYQLYTVGQRKGLGIATGKKAYVVDINSKTNIITVGGKNELFKSYTELVSTNFLIDLPNEFECECKIRSTAPRVRCHVEVGEVVKVRFSKPVIPVPGQIVAFYDGEYLLGGGVNRHVQ